MRRVTPDVIALIVVPTVTVLVAGSITLGVLMSVAGVVSVAIGTAATGSSRTVEPSPASCSEASSSRSS
ncbi:hypothetical protein [Curtobacterium poinsettiae]|uniref:hypothetical protein n=1 Tax=Curtobacterium poinsettiae TaxID=159612 RepID=UPI0021CA2F04|nr:hypothetical protein [Curtobacterium flaccumfaciens]UXN17013.1 hypothetical protein N8D78_08930 [Curtobacterium flaccumfaciens pv. poinsettiae]